MTREFCLKLLNNGDIISKNGGRKYLVHEGKWFILARILWDINNPHDTLKTGEEIHHKDEDPSHVENRKLVKHLWE